MNKARWIQKTHLFKGDEYVCSSCEEAFSRTYPVCPACGADMKKVKYDPSWIDEVIEPSALLDDDW